MSERRKIPKKALKPAYYKALYDDSMTRQNEPDMPYLSSAYKRAYALAVKGQAKDADELLKTARELVRSKRQARLEEEAERERLADREAAERERQALAVHNVAAGQTAAERAKIADTQRRKIMRRLYIRTHGADRVPKRVKRKPRTNRRYNLRGNARQRREPEILADNLDEYILDYVEKIKHKKELLKAFLIKMFNAGMVYRERSKKFAKPKN